MCCLFGFLDYGHSHAHYDDEAFDEDREELLGGMQDAGVGAIVNVGWRLPMWNWLNF